MAALTRRVAGVWGGCHHGDTPHGGVGLMCVLPPSSSRGAKPPLSGNTWALGLAAYRGVSKTVFRFKILNFHYMSLPLFPSQDYILGWPPIGPRSPPVPTMPPWPIWGTTRARRAWRPKVFPRHYPALPLRLPCRYSHATSSTHDGDSDGAHTGS